MKIIRTKNDLASEITLRRANGDKIGFVPTMGALHEGHLSLIECAKKHSECVVASIFVNPTQFAPHEDFGSYPRAEKSDADKLKKASADILFLPEESEIYPNGNDCSIKTGKAAQGLEATFRPTHFDGVVNVVSRLFNAVNPDIAVFGEKDFQQLQVIKEMVRDNNLPITIIGAPILRDECGLALSSRNAYLSDYELKIARNLNMVMRKSAKTKNMESAKNELVSHGFDKVDYVDIRWGRVLTAAWIGKTRLIDNMTIE